MIPSFRKPGATSDLGSLSARYLKVLQPDILLFMTRNMLLCMLFTPGFLPSRIIDATFRASFRFFFLALSRKGK